jgi:geranylgeranyl pyrophosphate synthase
MEMSAESKQRAIKKSFRQKGGQAMINARKKILRSFKDDSSSSQALRYFSKVTLHNALPVFPALISMSCEAVGGDAEKTIPFGEAIVLISAAADLHDDIIDKSSMKGKKQTVLGKFNLETSLLAGDILLSQGFKQLTDAADLIPKKQSKEIIKLVSKAVFEICYAEALEIQLHGKPDLTPKEIHEIIKLKAVVPQLAMEIGAIVGNANSRNVEGLARFGRTYGINSIIIEEFADLLDLEEFNSRKKNECLPLPVIYALQNRQIRSDLFSMLKPNLLNEGVHEKVIEVVLGSNEVQVLQKILVENANIELPKIVNRKMREELKNLLLVPLTYFED